MTKLEQLQNVLRKSLKGRLISVNNRAFIFCVTVLKSIRNALQSQGIIGAADLTRQVLLVEIVLNWRMLCHRTDQLMSSATYILCSASRRSGIGLCASDLDLHEVTM